MSVITFAQRPRSGDSTELSRGNWCRSVAQVAFDEWKEVDWYWTRKLLLSLRVRGFEESYVSFDIHNMCFEKKTESFNSGELKNIFRNIYCNHFIGLTASGKHAGWEEEEARKDSSTALMFQELLFISELFRDVLDAIPLIFHSRTMFYSERFLRVSLSRRMCNQCKVHHQFWINIWRSKFEEQTDSILSVCGSHGQEP